MRVSTERQRAALPRTQWLTKDMQSELDPAILVAEMSRKKVKVPSASADVDRAVNSGSVAGV